MTRAGSRASGRNIHSQESALSERTVQRVVDAWCVPGPAPDLHDKAVSDLRRRWPALASALDTLAKEQGRRPR